MNSPPKGTGALLHAPISEKLGRAQYKSAKFFAQLCSHPVTLSERFPGGMPHYSHEVCVACGRHLRWHPKPQNVERRKLIAAYVARLATCESLTSWEKGFVASVSKQRNFSPKQEAIIGRLYRKRWGSEP